MFITAEGRDITEKKAHEREIARQREELAKLDVLKTQFLPISATNSALR